MSGVFAGIGVRNGVKSWVYASLSEAVIGSCHRCLSDVGNGRCSEWFYPHLCALCRRRPLCAVGL